MNEEMKLIGTHNSATGEKGKGFLSLIGSPFAKCQTKTIKEQYAAGARYFDLRVKWHKGYWHCGHGLWTSKRLLEDVLCEINVFPESCHVIVTYEGSAKDAALNDFVDDVLWWRRVYKLMTWDYVAIKRPRWTILWQSTDVKWPAQGFVPLTGWRRLLPVPWLWHKLCRKEITDAGKYVLVDFL